MGGAAWEIPGFSFSLPANTDLSSESSNLFTPVIAVAATGAGINTDTAIAPVASTGDQIIGILQNNPFLGEAGDIVQNGITKVLCKGTISINQKVMATPSGGVIVCTAGNFAIGIALDNGAAGQYIPLLLTNMGKQ
jgi:hypothetical protein